ncbi:MAG: four helix bundle protein, partial [Anaerolineae bacterium]|nr:four helix bundle protein [Anaerolineae bacterium]
AIRVVNAYKYLADKKREFVLSKQLLRCGTAIGAMVREAEHAESKADFIHKMSVALKEANETDYWLDLLYKTDYFTEKEYLALKADAIELIKLLVSIINSSKKKMDN